MKEKKDHTCPLNTPLVTYCGSYYFLILALSQQHTYKIKIFSKNLLFFSDLCRYNKENNILILCRKKYEPEKPSDRIFFHYQKKVFKKKHFKFSCMKSF